MLKTSPQCHLHFYQFRLSHDLMGVVDAPNYWASDD